MNQNEKKPAAQLPPEVRKNDRSEHPPARKKHGRLWRGLLLSVVLTALILLVLVKLFPDTFDTDKLLRTFRYMGLRNQAGYGRITYDANPSNTYAVLGDGLLIGRENGLILSGLDGEQKAFVQGSMPDPVLSCGDEVCLCFSPGSSYIAALSSSGDILLDETQSGSFLDGDVSPDGYLCYITSESGYKSVSTVLNQKREPIFRFSSRTRYLNTCAISENGTWLAVAGLGEENSVYRSELTILDTSVATDNLEEDASIVKADLGNQVIYDLEFLDRTHICAIGEESIQFLTVEGELLQTLSLSERPLIDYYVSDDGILVIALGQATAGQSGEVLTLDAKGQTIAKQEFHDRILSVSAAGKYVAVLTDLYLEILNDKLETYSKYWEVYSAAQAIVRSDGTAFLIGANSATLYIP